MKLEIPTKKDFFKKLQNTFFYFGSSIIGMLISLITFPIYSSYLNAEDFGLMGYFASIGAFLTPMFNLGMSNYFLMKYFKQTEIENKKMFFNILFYLTINNIIVAILSYGAIALYFHFAKVSFPIWPFLLFTLITSIFEPYKSFLLLQYRVLKEGIRFFLVSVLSPIINALLSILLLYLGLGIKGRMGGLALAYILIGSLAIFILLKKFTSKDYSFNKFKNTISTVYPLVLAGYAYIPINSLDRILLERLKNINELGLYSIGLTFSGFFYTAAFALFTAFEPDIYRGVIEKNKKIFSNNIKLFLAILILGFITFLAILPFIINILTKGKFLGSLNYSIWLTCGYLVSSLALIFNAIILALQKVKYSAYVIYFGAVATIILFPIFINFWGFNGSLAAKILVPVLALLYNIYLYKKSEKIFI